MIRTLHELLHLWISPWTRHAHNRSVQHDKQNTFGAKDKRCHGHQRVDDRHDDAYDEVNKMFSSLEDKSESVIYLFVFKRLNFPKHLQNYCKSLEIQRNLLKLNNYWGNSFPGCFSMTFLHCLNSVWISSPRLIIYQLKLAGWPEKYAHSPQSCLAWVRIPTQR